MREVSRLQRLGALAALGSAAMLAGALAFQHLGGLAPCKLCIWQRWPHGLAAGLGLLLLVVPARALGRLIALSGAGIVAIGAGIAAYHTGVEQGWFAGPDSCTAAPPGSLSVDELMAQILATPVVRCDEIAWSMAGLSMPAWNALISAVLAGIWIWAVLGRGQASSSASQ